MGCEESEAGSCSETCVTCVDDGIEEAIGIKDEIPEAIIFPPIKTEHEVRLWGV
jgi:hypothetical protein